MTKNHRQYYNFCVVNYWDKNGAAFADEEWTHCNVSPLGLHTHGEQSFENTPEGISRRDGLIAFLDKAYERGRSDAKREIREVLGVKEPRP